MNGTEKIVSLIGANGARKKKALIALVCAVAIVAVGAGLGYRHLKANGLNLTDSALFQTTEAGKSGLSALGSADASGTGNTLSASSRAGSSGTAKSSVSKSPSAEKSTSASTGDKQTSSKSSSTKSSKKKSSTASSASGSSTNGTGSSNPSSSTNDTQKSTVTVKLSIDCNTAVANKIPEALALTSSGSLLNTEITLPRGSSVYDVLKKSHAVVGANSTSMGVYVYSIDGLAEKAGGYSSAGWQYEVNGVYASKACNSFTVSDGDTVRWRYSCNAGKDL